MNRREFERLRKLRELQRLGMAVAQDLHARARTERDPKKLAELAESFLVVGQDIRRAIALEAKLAREIEVAPSDPQPRLRPGRPAAPDPRLANDPPTPTRH
jgi:hypothetical protein